MTDNRRIAVIDLGTNTCKLLIAESDGTDLTAVVEETRVVRLGENVDATGELTPAAMDRTAGVFEEYKSIIDANDCKEVRCVGTSAFRDAENQQVLNDRLTRSTGLTVKALSGEDEARLVAEAVQNSFPFTDGRRVIVDIGGGSTEIMIENNGALERFISLSIGAVRLTERLLHSDPPTAEEIRSAQLPIIEAFKLIIAGDPADKMVSVGGTATTFITMAEGMETYDHQRVHGSTLTREVLMEQMTRCATVPLAERIQIVGLHPGRAEIIIAGGLIQVSLMAYFGMSEILVSDRGLRWGVAAQMIKP